MTALNATAKATLRAAGVSQADWARTSAGQLPPVCGTEWTGDACGCPDDRCIGYHHDPHEECGCLRVLLDQYLNGKGRFPGAPGA
jgi:hypothetical protein